MKFGFEAAANESSSDALGYSAASCAPPQTAESRALQREAKLRYDPTTAEQTWPTEEELKGSKRRIKLPKGPRNLEERFLSSRE